MKPLVVIGFLGSTLDASKFGPSRWNKWRPTVGLTHARGSAGRSLRSAPRQPRTRGSPTMSPRTSPSVSPETTVEPRLLDFADPWDFEEVYGKLLDFARA